MATAAELRKQFGLDGGGGPALSLPPVDMGMAKSTPQVSAKTTVANKQASNARSLTPVTDALRTAYEKGAVEAPMTRLTDRPKATIEPAPTTISAGPKKGIVERGLEALDRVTGTKIGRTVLDSFSDEATTINRKQLGGLYDLVPFSGSALKPREEKVDERYAALKDAGIDEDRATAIAVADTIPSQTARYKAVEGLKLNDAEKAAIRGSGFFENLDAALSVVDIATLGTAKGVTASFKILAKESSEEAIKRTLTTEFKLSEQTANRIAPAIAKVGTEEEVGRIVGAAQRGEGSVVPRSPELSPAMREIEDEAATMVELNEDKMVQEYLQKNGNVINTDEARELFPAYRADRTQSAAVHEPASYLSKRAYDHLLATKKETGNNTVLFTAGGTGAGKTYSIGKLVDDLAEFPIVYDTNLNTLNSTVNKIEKALEKGFEVKIGYVYNDIDKAMDNALSRSERMIDELGTGRTVPIDTHIDTHVGSQKVLQELMAKYAEDPRVDISVLDNSGEYPRLVEKPLAFMREKGYTGTNDELRRQLKTQISGRLAGGSISSQTAEGFLGKSSASQADGGRVKGGESVQAEEEVATSLPETPDIPAAPDAASSRPLQKNSPAKRPGKEELKQPGLQGVLKSSDSFKEELGASGDTITMRAAEQDIPPAGPKDPSKRPVFENFRHKVGNAWNAVREQIQDDMLRVKQLVENPEIKVSEASDPYQAEILFHGRVGHRLEEAQDLARDIDRDVVRLAEDVGLSDGQFTEEVNRYLIARHAPERNAALEDGAAGMTTAEANAARAEIERSAHGAAVKKVADRIQDFNNRTLDVLLEGEVIDQGLYDLLRTKYKNHIPLNRVFEGEEDIGSALGRGFDVRSSGIKAAQGSQRKVADIMENVVTNYQQALIRAEKNRVDLATLRMVRDNKESLGHIFEEVKPRAIGRKFADDGTEGGIILEQITDPQTLVLRENGRPVYLHIKDPNLAAALRGIGREKLSGLMRGVGAITRFYSGLATRFNPEFAFANKLRDIQEVMVYAGAQGELGAKGAASVAGRSVRLENERAVWDFLRDKDTEGALLYKQMREDGGTTGGLGLSTRQQVQQDLESIRKLNRSNPRAGAKKVVEIVDAWNTIFEDSTRLSVYREALKRGASRQRAARLAKEASVNFNKAGKAGPMINALYMFSNASIQGSSKMLMAMKNPKVAAATVMSVAAPVIAVNEWNDHIDPEWRSKVTKWDRLNALPIMLPSTEGSGVRYITIPVSWGLKPIKVMADQISDLSNGKSEGIVDAMSAVMVSAIEGYNPSGGTDLISAITPTVLDMPVELGRNQAWSGNKIRPDWDKYAPGSIQYFDSLKDSTSGQTAIALTRGLSGIGMEVSPADLNYVFEQLIGGAGRSANKVISTVADAATLQTPALRDTPILSRFLKSRTEEEVGAGTDKYEDLKGLLQEDSREAFYLKQQAEDSYNQMKNLPPEEAKQRWDELNKADKALAAKVADIAKAEKKNLNYTDRMIQDLGVENGARAKYLVTEFEKLGTKEEKARLWSEYVEKGILTKAVQKQVKYLLNQEQKSE